MRATFIGGAAAGVGCLAMAACADPGAYGGPSYSPSYSARYGGYGPSYVSPAYGYTPGPVLIPGAIVGVDYGRDRYRRDDFARQRFERERTGRDAGAREHLQRQQERARPEATRPDMRSRPEGAGHEAGHRGPPPQAAAPRPLPPNGLIGRPVGRPPWERG